MKQQDRSIERNQDFVMTTFFLFFWSSPPNMRANFVQKKNNIGFGAKCSPDRCLIPNSTGRRCVSVSSPKFLCPSPQTHHSGSVPDTILFYSQGMIYTVVCNQTANKSSSFVFLNVELRTSF